MAVTNTTIRASKQINITDVAASADADTTATIAHGFGEAPEEVILTWLAATAAISLWRVTTIDATNIVLTKATTAGSGGAPVQVRCIARRHTHVTAG